ncbi:hypothetical protein [Actinosynnema mirum]|uniref:NUDIX hydrolase n=1 Tax=Actinosynnema mirum (strain ATCC 29888 / DSM 43827 / JCM 3225 / NBRC 14064 / NCIMB 13271 / NRRL B-12336 / IMRU 3971 / 101) TaxID=446462 RepID=C6WBC3_ACTMD|nr:hypothetical protein [Actinosynnema mirum]ACU39414.1 hypothetical protein Amir_5596 [Actinosynnema mirum DSM 43827]
MTMMINPPATAVVLAYDRHQRLYVLLITDEPGQGWRLPGDKPGVGELDVQPLSYLTDRLRETTGLHLTYSSADRLNPVLLRGPESDALSWSVLDRGALPELTPAEGGHAEWFPLDRLPAWHPDNPGDPDLLDEALTVAGLKSSTHVCTPSCAPSLKSRAATALRWTGRELVGFLDVLLLGMAAYVCGQAVWHALVVPTYALDGELIVKGLVGAWLFLRLRRL